MGEGSFLREHFRESTPPLSLPLPEYRKRREEPRHHSERLSLAAQ
jgi:hypothetical protein